MDELIVECPLRSAGCPHTCQRQLLESHVKDACQYATVPCSEEGCHQMILRKDCGKHADVCVHRATECDGCGISVKYSDLTVGHVPCFQVGRAGTLFFFFFCFFLGCSGSLFGMFLKDCNLFFLRYRNPALRAAGPCDYVFGSRPFLSTCREWVSLGRSTSRAVRASHLVMFV